ncbi:hypothetical protein [Holdemania sp. Marseille-P2844]|uniref:hypothetical protein n=1 Tax=Holdemania sp. Marseille-P2844 TaxID=1852366 RepID=UPI000B1D5E4C|nr:hypothetical protein [Holdemania sp. Marseille-P2844]
MDLSFDSFVFRACFLQLWKGGAFYEFFHGTFVFFNDKGHSGGCPAFDNQLGLHLKNYRTQKKLDNKKQEFFA